MKVPKYIKDAIKKKAKHSSIARQNDDIIRDWLIKNNIHNGCVIDYLIDSCEMTNSPDSFTDFLESQDFEGMKGNEY
ncbi:hypothetical protein SECTIM467_157 [Brevibacillus phage SecTim467]|uniref:Uncharacterized protein n=2 Tax=Jenstvirus jenst TaxID=1982225 RepID=A0A0K2CPE0_9CAUD|nr:hypothetical protein AVV11_gp039 [Brevibacillus phage Jenst]ALA07281.1 hypothetical protein JENST_152 [Brevibacillus phage Jenst]ALA07480.1 hypothetical protein SECTIM467_157 [Brevibacillus phage SecTim467]